MKVYELRSWLENFDDDADVIVDYVCSDDWYNYYGSDITITLDGKDIVLTIEN